MRMEMRNLVIVILSVLVSFCATGERNIAEWEQLHPEELYIKYPIHVLAKMGTPAMIRKYVVEYKLPVDDLAGEKEWTPLMYAAAGGNLENAKTLVSLGAKVNYQSGKCGCTPLLVAVSQPEAGAEHLKIAEFLVSKGADLSKSDIENCNALVYPVKHKKYEIIKFLLSKAVFDLEAKDKMGNSVWDYAEKANSPEIIGILKASKSNHR